MRKTLLSIVTVLFVILLTACGGNKVDDATAEKYIAKAEEVILYLNEGDYEAVYATFNDEMKEGLPVAAMAELTPVIEESGEFKEIDKASVEEKDGHYITVLQGKYTNKNRIYTITFNQNDEVSGLFIK